MTRQMGRDAAEGYVWLYDPSLIKGGGPERVVYDDPAPDDWTPPPFLGFTRRNPGAEPLLWDGDDS